MVNNYEVEQLNERTFEFAYWVKHKTKMVAFQVISHHLCPMDEIHVFADGRFQTLGSHPFQFNRNRILKRPGKDAIGRLFSCREEGIRTLDTL